MQLHLTFSARHVRLPLSHRYALQGMLYNALASNPHYSNYVHNSGYSCARAIISFLLSAVFRDRSCTANVKSSLRIPCILRFAALIRISCINSVRCCVRAAKSICLKTHLKFWTAALKIIHPIPAVQKSQCCRLLRFLKPRKAVIAAL